MENEKHTLLQQLLELTKQQEQALKEENIEEFETLMNSRQAIMNAVDALHIANPMLKEQKEEELLKELMALDNKNRAEFDKQLETIKSKLREIREQKKRDNFYNNPYTRATEEGVFFDKR